MLDKILCQRAYDKIIKAQNILLIAHRRPDADTLGSSLAIANLLVRRGTRYVHFCEDLPGKQFEFLPRVEYITSDESKLANENFDLIISSDASDFRQAGLAERLSAWQGNIPIINFDHHFTNTGFGDFNFVMRDSASTAEVIYLFLNQVGAEIDKKIATCLLAGILGDTINFTTFSTGVLSFGAASELLARGAEFNRINKFLLQNRDLAGLKFWGDIFSRISENKRLGIVFSVIKKEDLEKNQISEEAIEGLANFLGELGSANIAMVLKEEGDGVIKGSLRTNRSDIDVSHLAQLLGGGGHERAAGFRLAGRLIEGGEGWRVE